MKSKILAFIIIGTSRTLFGQKENNSDLTLWYKQPAKNWNEALPVGNGRVGAMVFGKIWNGTKVLYQD